MMPTDNWAMGPRFKAIAKEHAGRIALAFPDGTNVSYQELDELSDQFAAHLLARGVNTHDVVAIYAEKSVLTYSAMIAALKIGAPYVVLDTASPKERIDKIFGCCNPKIILADRKFPSAVMLTELEQPTEPANLPDVSPDTPAYIMFTSGSTGTPKGVTIAHHSMVRFCDWARRTYSITPDDRLTGVNALYFDNSVFDFCASLFNGACLVPVNRDIVTQPKQLVEAVADCTLWFSVPSLLIYVMTLRALTKESWPRMRAITFGGEGFAKGELKKLYDMYGAQATLWNVYGPTECTCICSAHPLSNVDFHDMNQLATLGHMADIFEAMVMNETATSQVQDGCVGELFLMGPQVAIGYYNELERTASAFARNPLKPDTPCYRTGDLVTKDPKTGYYYFAGRKDNQIKHMGYRIELEEIEAALHAIAGIAQSGVIYHKQDGAHAGEIIAFVSGEGDEAGIKEKLKTSLPPYMIPAKIMVMESLPKNANGKVDRKALAEKYTSHPTTS